MKKVSKAGVHVLLMFLVIGLVLVGGCSKGPEEKPSVTQSPTQSQKEAQPQRGTEKISSALEDVASYFLR